MSLLLAAACGQRPPLVTGTTRPTSATKRPVSTRPTLGYGRTTQPAAQPATQPTRPTTQPTGPTTQPTTRPRPTGPILAKVVRCGDPRSKQIALTFDDGPYLKHEQTSRVLAILRRYHVKATFFVLGRLAHRYPRLLRKIVAEGHLLASHSWDHPRKQSYAGWKRQLERTEAALRRARVASSRYYRPPHGIVNERVRRVCGELGYTIVLYTLLSSDWRRPGHETLVRQVTRRLSGGGIVVLHDGGGDRSQTIAALPAIIAGLRTRGLEPVRLDRLLEGGGHLRCRAPGKTRAHPRRVGR